MQGSITEPHTLAQALKSSSLQSSGWSNLQDPDDISVSGAGEPPAAKKMKQCGPTSAELKPDVKGTFHPSGPKF